MSEFFLILLVLFLVFGVFRRWIVFFLLSALGRRLQRELMKQQGRSPGPAKPRGTVTVEDHSKASKKGPAADDGDYVDYEEIKD